MKYRWNYFIHSVTRTLRQFGNLFFYHSSGVQQPAWAWFIDLFGPHLLQGDMFTIGSSVDWHRVRIDRLDWQVSWLALRGDIAEHDRVTTHYLRRFRRQDCMYCEKYSRVQSKASSPCSISEWVKSELNIWAAVEHMPQSPGNWTKSPGTIPLLQVYPRDWGSVLG
jgi:hypothetical protein